MTREPPRIRLVVMDVDGTLTDGRITYNAEGLELKSFHARDGAGIKLLGTVGIAAAICSGRTSTATSRRAAELGIETVHQSVSDKAARFAEICAAHDLQPAEGAFFGDDLSDLPAMLLAGFSAAPLDAAPEVAAAADHVAAVAGGHGAVRDGIEALLRHEGLWDQILTAHGLPREQSETTA